MAWLKDFIGDLPTPRPKLRFTGFLKVTPGKRHAWYQTKDLPYPVRKELGKVKI